MGDVYLFREEDETVVDIDSAEGSEEEWQGALLCRFCGHHITRPAHVIEVDDGHHHTFFNPAGIIYEIRCFSKAEGCAHYGPASSEFAWFKGYTWRLVFCRGCAVHMGWHFSSGKMGFYGLIGKNLAAS
ncbi:MAG: cereblon family protein [Desulfopila sp.]